MSLFCCENVSVRPKQLFRPKQTCRNSRNSCFCFVSVFLFRQSRNTTIRLKFRLIQTNFNFWYFYWVTHQINNFILLDWIHSAWNLQNLLVFSNARKTDPKNARENSKHQNLKTLFRQNRNTVSFRHSPNVSAFRPKHFFPVSVVHYFYHV